MTQTAITPLPPLADLAAQLLELSLRHGATQAQVGFFQQQGLSLHQLQGRIVSRTRETASGFTLTVFQGSRSGQVSSTGFSGQSLDESAAAANAIARHTESDPAAGLAPAQWLCAAPRALDLYHPWALDEQAASELAGGLEDGISRAGRQVQSHGAWVSCSQGVSFLATTEGFAQGLEHSNHSLSVAAIARDAAGQAEQEHAFDTVRDARCLQAPEQLGQTAGQAAAAYLDRRPLRSRSCPVLFSPRCASSLVGHLIAAISGRSLYLDASFLKGKLGQGVLSDHLDLRSDPFLPGGVGSFAFDGDGIEPSARLLIEAGRLQGYLLSLYSARRLNLAPTGNGSGHGNLSLTSRLTQPSDDLAAMLGKLGTGFFVTHLAGEGVELINGNYARSARGFWVENGTLAHAVTGVALSGNLSSMLSAIVAVGADLSRQGSTTSGSLLIDRMQLSGH